jgi:hypothetical protein
MPRRRAVKIADEPRGRRTSARRWRPSASRPGAAPLVDDLAGIARYTPATATTSAAKRGPSGGSRRRRGGGGAGWRPRSAGAARRADRRAASGRAAGQPRADAAQQVGELVAVEEHEVGREGGRREPPDVHHDDEVGVEDDAEAQPDRAVRTARCRSSRAAAGGACRARPEGDEARPCRRSRSPGTTAARSARLHAAPVFLAGMWTGSVITTMQQAVSPSISQHARTVQRCHVGSGANARGA